MRRIFSQIVSKNYVTKSPATEVPKGRGTVTPSVVRVSAISATSPSPSSLSTSTKKHGGSRSISMSSGPGSIPSASSTSPSIVGPLLSSTPYPVPKFTPKTPQKTITPVIKEVVLPSQYSAVERERRRRSQYASLLDASVDMILSRGYTSSSDAIEKAAFISDLNVKRVLSKNEEMKKVIFKVAAMALAQNEEDVGGIGSLHPFIITAGEVFFGGSYNEMGLGENPGSIQDILTPGLLVLLLHTAFLTGEQVKTLSQKQLLLAKALVETSAGYLLHRTVEETNHLMEDTPENSRHFERMHQGNKLATLTGDLLVVSLIKNVACTGNNQVLELVMNSLSEFSTTEIAKRKPFETTESDPLVCRAMKPHNLAESIVFSKGFQSSLMLSGMEDQEVLDSAAQLGSVAGLLWKNNFDWTKLTSLGKGVDNLDELNDYLAGLREQADELLSGNKFIPSPNHPVTGMMRHLIHFWGAPKSNISQ